MTSTFNLSAIIVICLIAICIAVPFTLSARKTGKTDRTEEKTEEYVVGNVDGGHKSAKKLLKKTEEVKMTLPDGELFTGVEFFKEEHPYVGILNTKIMELSPKEIFGWYLSLMIY